MVGLKKMAYNVICQGIDSALADRHLFVKQVSRFHAAHAENN